MYALCLILWLANALGMESNSNSNNIGQLTEEMTQWLERKNFSNCQLWQKAEQTFKFGLTICPVNERKNFINEFKRGLWKDIERETFQQRASKFSKFIWSTTDGSEESYQNCKQYFQNYFAQDPDSHGLELALYHYSYARLLRKECRKLCSNVNCTKKAGQICKACKNTHYCSRSCQEKHWGSHKLQCRNASEEMLLRWNECLYHLEMAIALEMSTERGFTNIRESKLLHKGRRKCNDISINAGQEISVDSVATESVKSIAELCITKLNNPDLGLKYVKEALKVERSEGALELLRKFQKNLLEKWLANERKKDSD
eukprot:527138_1